MVDSSDVVLRVGDASDGLLVGRCVFLALAWDPERSLPAQEVVLAHPDVVRYHGGWGRPGDVVVVAEADLSPVAYAFARLFTPTDHGHGFVDDATPEMGVAVEPGHRGQGLGTQVLTRLHEELRRAGFPAVSLSVELSNPARRLYDRLGYIQIAERDEAAIMMLSL